MPPAALRKMQLSIAIVRKAHIVTSPALCLCCLRGSWERLKKTPLHLHRIERLHKEMGDQREMLTTILTAMKKQEQRQWLDVGEFLPGDELDA